MTGDISTRSLEIIIACTTNYTTETHNIINLHYRRYPYELLRCSYNINKCSFINVCTIMFNVCCLSNAMQCMDASRTVCCVQHQKLHASLFTRWRHSQYNQYKLKAQTPRHSSVDNFLLHCVDNWTVLLHKNVFQTVRCYNRWCSLSY